MSRMARFLSLACLATLAMLPAAAEASASNQPAVNVQQAAGTSAAAIQSTVDAYRADLGTLNPNIAGSFGSGRREINWDGVPDAFSVAKRPSRRLLQRQLAAGRRLHTPGSGFQVSANAGVAPIEFDNINPTYSSLFTVFSPQRLFTAIDSKFTDVDFFVPGSSTPATTSGFGSVFTDVDGAREDPDQVLRRGTRPLATFDVPASPGSETLSFLGVRFLDERSRGSGSRAATALLARTTTRSGPRRDGRLHLRRTRAVTATTVRRHRTAAAGISGRSIPNRPRATKGASRSVPTTALGADPRPGGGPRKHLF